MPYAVKCLVDTNVISELARVRPDPRTVSWFEVQIEYALSVVTIEEIAFGVARAQTLRRAKLIPWFDAVLAASRLLDVTPEIARAAGELRAARFDAGRPAQPADMLIAATAIVHGLTLVTRNVKDFDGTGVVVFDPFAA